MPTLTLPSGATLTWEDQSVTPAPVPEVATVAPPDTSTLVPEALGPTQTAADVKVALNTVPPKWTATAARFAKTLAAAATAAFIATGGTVGGVLHDPSAFFGAVITAVIMAFQKYLSWKD